MAKTTSDFNSDRTIQQHGEHAHGLLLEIPFVPSRTDRWAVRAGKNGRLGGRRGETWSRNMAATQKINFLTLVSYSVLQTVFLAKTYHFTTIQNVTDRKTGDRQTTQCAKGSTDSTVANWFRYECAAQSNGKRTWKSVSIGKVIRTRLYSWLAVAMQRFVFALPSNQNQIKFICSNISQINIGNSKSIHEQGNKAENSTNSDPKTVG